jgi:hypothetical protein
VNVAPGATFEAVIDTGTSGLVGTITVEANDNNGTTAIAATSLGISEIASGVYAATGLVAPTTAGQYTLIWKAADAGVQGIEDLVVTSSAPADPGPPPDVYGTVDELFRRLKIRTPTVEQTAAADRIMVAASTEVNLKMGRSTGLDAGELAIATEATLERGAELWNESEVPFGAIGLDNPSGPVFVSRNSRALAKLGRIQETWGVG